MTKEIVQNSIASLREFANRLDEAGSSQDANFLLGHIDTLARSIEWLDQTLKVYTCNIYTHGDVTGSRICEGRLTSSEAYSRFLSAAKESCHASTIGDFRRVE